MCPTLAQNLEQNPENLGILKNYLDILKQTFAIRKNPVAFICSGPNGYKARGIDPMAWLTAVLNRIPDHKANRLLELLPGMNPSY